MEPTHKLDLKKSGNQLQQPSPATSETLISPRTRSASAPPPPPTSSKSPSSPNHGQSELPQVEWNATLPLSASPWPKRDKKSTYSPCPLTAAHTPKSTEPTSMSTSPSTSTAQSITRGPTIGGSFLCISFLEIRGSHISCVILFFFILFSLCFS
ncbi:hypothetical protein LINPERHAP2_LOCUS15682 [Linum perenne]